MSSSSTTITLPDRRALRLRVSAALVAELLDRLLRRRAAGCGRSSPCPPRCRPPRGRRARARCRAPSTGPCRCPCRPPWSSRTARTCGRAPRGAMPGPLSRTDSSTKRPAKLLPAARCRPRAWPRAARTASVIAPSPCMASRALMHRLSSTCSSCTGSARTAPTLCVQARLELDASRAASGAAACAASATSGGSASTRGAPRWPRLKVSICWIRSRARLRRERARARGSAASLASPRLLDVLGGERQVAQDALQDVVEVVRDAAGEVADRLHLLRLAQLRLELHPLRFLHLARGDVARHAERVRPAAVADRHRAHLDVEQRAVLAPRPGSRTAPTRRR